jgi:hypothetical protein
MPSDLHFWSSLELQVCENLRDEAAFGEWTSDMEALVNGVVSCAVELSDCSPMPVGAHRNLDRRPVACVDIGFPVVSLYGSAAAMRRLAQAATRAAEEAERLPRPQSTAMTPPLHRPLAFAENAGGLSGA